MLENLERELNHIAPQYSLRFTIDLHVIDNSRDLEALTAKGKLYRDFKVHIVDANGTCVWQNAESQRYGTVGVA